MVQAVQLVEDLRPATRNMITGAIAVTTGRLNLEHPDDAMARVASGDPVALDYFRHELAHQVAMLILRTDSLVTAVYKEHELPEAEELGAPELTLADPVHLVLYSERRTAALMALIEGIDRSLAEALSDHCGRVPCGIVRAEIVEQSRVARMPSRSLGFRPPPVLLVAREDRESLTSNDAHTHRGFETG